LKILPGDRLSKFRFVGRKVSSCPEFKQQSHLTGMEDDSNEKSPAIHSGINVLVTTDLDSNLNVIYNSASYDESSIEATHLAVNDAQSVSAISSNSPDFSSTNQSTTSMSSTLTSTTSALSTTSTSPVNSVACSSDCQSLEESSTPNAQTTEVVVMVPIGDNSPRQMENVCNSTMEPVPNSPNSTNHSSSDSSNALSTEASNNADINVEEPSSDLLLSTLNIKFNEGLYRHMKWRFPMKEKYFTWSLSNLAYLYNVYYDMHKHNQLDTDVNTLPDLNHLPSRGSIVDNVNETIPHTLVSANFISVKRFQATQQSSNENIINANNDIYMRDSRETRMSIGQKKGSVSSENTDHDNESGLSSPKPSSPSTSRDPSTSPLRPTSVGPALSLSPSTANDSMNIINERELPSADTQDADSSFRVNMHNLLPTTVTYVDTMLFRNPWIAQVVETRAYFIVLWCSMIVYFFGFFLSFGSTYIYAGLLITIVIFIFFEMNRASKSLIQLCLFSFEYNFVIILLVARVCMIVYYRIVAGHGEFTTKPFTHFVVLSITTLFDAYLTRDRFLRFSFMVCVILYQAYTMYLDQQNIDPTNPNLNLIKTCFIYCSNLQTIIVWIDVNLLILVIKLLLFSVRDPNRCIFVTAPLKRML
jgi:hypothetical protein